MDFAESGEGAQVNRLQNAMEASDIAWWEMNVSEGRVQFHDRKAKMLGYDPDTFDHYEDFTDLLHPDDYDRTINAMESHLEGKAEMYDVEYRIEANDGSYHWFHDVGGITERNDDGSPKLVSGLVVNISEQKEREQQLRREKERLDEFASVVSHDLRNPLTVAKGRIARAQKEYDSDDLNAAADSIERSLALIEDMLTLAQEGQMVSETEPVDVASLVETCWKDVETANTKLTAELDLTIQTDRSRLRQLLENLIRNAVEHGGEDVTVRVGSLPDGFYVEDDGPGIPENDRESVFELGYSESHDGIGFGLSIVKQIAEAHGWKVEITEGTDGGARFEFTHLDGVAE
jgi:PAS domain S-box-containing protein